MKIVQQKRSANIKVRSGEVHHVITKDKQSAPIALPKKKKAAQPTDAGTAVMEKLQAFNDELTSPEVPRLVFKSRIIKEEDHNEVQQISLRRDSRNEHERHEQSEVMHVRADLVNYPLDVPPLRCESWLIAERFKVPF